MLCLLICSVYRNGFSCVQRRYECPGTRGNTLACLAFVRLVVHASTIEWYTVLEALGDPASVNKVLASVQSM